MNGDLFSKSFDHLLAFVLPGLVVLWGYSYVDPNGLGAWFVTASTTNTSVGGFLFLLLAALRVGVFVSGVKSLVFERWFRLFPEPPPFDEKRRTESGVLEAYADARHNHYYYHLFYANMLCAAPVVLIGSMAVRMPTLTLVRLFGGLAVFVSVEFVLFMSAQHAITRFKIKAEQILGVIGGTPAK